ncbi:MAG: AmmeMemoRadiSam system protein A [Candidatus Aminicenantes bacterium]
MDDLLDEAQQKFLLTLARKAIRQYLESGKTLRVKIEDERLKAKRGAFVTLKVNHQLRGCIGYPLPHKPLYETIIEVAISAATQDFRFQPLTLEELSDTKIEISVLSLPKPVQDVKEIEIGKHGIMVSKGLNKGLLLPQVPEEWGWDLETYLGQGCLKAGLEQDEWKKEGCCIEIFSAQVFSDQIKK